MSGFFYNLGKRVGPKVRKTRWVWDSLTAGEDEILRAEYATGRDMAQAIIQEMPADRDPDAARFVQEIGQRLTGRLTQRKRQWMFYLVGSESPNAFALPGGFIFITRSLLDLCERNPDETAFILGHEIGHVIRGHSFDRLVSSTLFSAIQVTPAGRMLNPRVLGAGLKLMQSAYTQDQELEADAFGMRLAHSAGFDPSASIRMMQRLETAHGNEQLPELFAYFSTHPPFPARINAMEQLRSK